MPRCPFARWEPIERQEYYDTLPERMRVLEKTQLILHSATVSYRQAIAGWKRDFNFQVHSTFFVLNDGALVQLVESENPSPANSTANRRAISVETEDYGQPDRRKWTPSQVATLVRLAKWVHDEHGVPLSPCKAHDQPGIGFHSMWSDSAAINPWIKKTRRVVGKTCPGIIRIPQFFDEIMTELGYPATSNHTDEVFRRWGRDPRPRRRTRKRRGSSRRGE